MGSYCDSCYCLHGSIFQENNLKELDGHDLCPQCFTEVSQKINEMIKEHSKGNIIEGVRP